ncbi:uncharacterized protein LOC104002326 [Pan troglodytes]|uniref:Uncharacterized protein n=2 Tax=Pan TaxID=9596 RepID=G2HJD1_PANTR|nr:uncharacterized protein LOC104002326 [Pan troglodytes]BAK63839.1 hypothetical protein [Pan troglodytes]
MDAQRHRRGQPDRVTDFGARGWGLRRSISQRPDSFASNFAGLVGAGGEAGERREDSREVSRYWGQNRGQGRNRELLTLKLLQVARPHPGGRRCAPLLSRRALDAHSARSVRVRLDSARTWALELSPAASRAARSATLLERPAGGRARLRSPGADGGSDVLGLRRALLWAPRLR